MLTFKLYYEQFCNFMIFNKNKIPVMRITGIFLYLFGKYFGKDPNDNYNFFESNVFT